MDFADPISASAIQRHFFVELPMDDLYLLLNVRLAVGALASQIVTRLSHEMISSCVLSHGRLPPYWF
jgi:hypothetical protein